MGVDVTAETRIKPSAKVGAVGIVSGQAELTLGEVLASARDGRASTQKPRCIGPVVLEVRLVDHKARRSAAVAKWWIGRIRCIYFIVGSGDEAGASRALISEAVRGEGGKLVDKSGNRFMPDYHPQAELAPRDIVSRAILDQLAKTQATSVYLDARHLGAAAFASRFPTIHRLCADFGIDVAKDLIPVRPSAHYMIGGVWTDLRGGTSLSGLLACGEAAARRGAEVRVSGGLRVRSCGFRDACFVLRILETANSTRNTL